MYCAEEAGIKITTSPQICCRNLVPPQSFSEFNRESIT